jgi:hypothetical protein
VRAGLPLPNTPPPPGDAPLKNIPALAFSLISTPANAEKLDGFAFQKLPKQR